MNWYKIAKEEEKRSPWKSPPQSFKDMFGDDWDLPDYESETKEEFPPEEKTVEIDLYRGFDYLPPPNPDGTYTLSPEKSEGKTLWFTSILGTVDFPKDFAKDLGKYFLTYPLKTTKHFQKVIYTNEKTGEQRTSETCPKDILEKNKGNENSKYFGCFELPDGFYFSYKVQKHIVCDIPITVTPDMIQKSKDVGEDDELV